jgi:type I restriction enzyme, S subunit
VIPLENIAAQLRNGKSVRQSEDAGGLPITRIETIAEGVINGERVGFAGLEEADCIEWLLEEGDILISHINSTKHLGKCAIYAGEPPILVHGMNLLGLRVKQEAALPRYVYRMMTSPGFRQQIPRITKHSVNQSSFNISNFKKLEIPLPPLSEQRRIAGILDAADALRAKRREALAQLDTLLQSTFLDMFGDPVTNPMGWEVVELRKLGKITTGKTPPTKNHGMFGGEIPFATPGDLDNGLQATARTITLAGAKFTKVVRAGSALVGCIGNIGKMAKSPVPTAFNQQINAIEWTERINDSFGIHALTHCIPQMRSKASSTTVPILNKSGFSSVQMMVPDLALQRRFATIVESVERQKARMRAHLAELDALFASLQSRAFKGAL